MIVLTMLASAAATDCSDFAYRSRENMSVTMTAITEESLGGKPAIGDLKYMGNGFVIRSSDARLAGVEVGQYGFGHSCGFRLTVPWQGSTFLRFETDANWRATPQINAFDLQTSTPVLDGYVAGTSIGHRASGNGFQLALMYPVDNRRETVIVAYGSTPPRIIARLPMRFDLMMFLLNPHGPASQLDLQGREADGTLNRVTFDIGGLQRDALVREFGDPAQRALNLCPIGGEPYEVFTATSYSTMGQRPDGKPYSYMKFPFPLPECASNKLIVFDRFTGQEVGLLADIIQTPEYLRLATSDVPYYRAYWLASQLGRPAAQALNFLRQAIWETTPDAEAADTDDNRARRARYQGDFIAGVQLLPSNTSRQDRLVMESHAANAARQLGRYEDAGQLRNNALSTLQQVERKNGWDVYLEKLGVVIARRDDSPEPLDMIPEHRVTAICRGRGPANDFDVAICSKSAVAR